MNDQELDALLKELLRVSMGDQFGSPTVGDFVSKARKLADEAAAAIRALRERVKDLESELGAR